MSLSLLSHAPIRAPVPLSLTDRCSDSGEALQHQLPLEDRQLFIAVDLFEAHAGADGMDRGQFDKLLVEVTSLPFPHAYHPTLLLYHSMLLLCLSALRGAPSTGSA